MKAVVTLCIGDAYSLGEVTHPLLKAYADKIGADFIVINTPKLNFNYAHYEKYQIYDLLNDYERIIYLDTDIIVSPKYPNLFDIVPEKQFGAFVVSKHTYFHDRAIKDIQKVLGEIGWKREYFNSGVMVLSKCHREIFNKNHDLLVWASEKRNFYEQTILNYHLQKLSVPIYDIGYKFNHTTDVKNSRYRFGRRVNQVINFGEELLSSISDKYKQHREWKIKNEGYIVHYQGKKTIKHRFNSYIIDYTGKGHRQRGSKLEQIQKDLFVMQHQPLLLAMQIFPSFDQFL
ncbi:MAG: glycosyltransferase [Nostocaceae cyanobacterium]|nr:glycosyltransferase [Nostocaceae cyanobacterium]